MLEELSLIGFLDGAYFSQDIIYFLILSLSLTWYSKCNRVIGFVRALAAISLTSGCLTKGSMNNHYLRNPFLVIGLWGLKMRFLFLADCDPACHLRITPDLSASADRETSL